MEVREWRAWKAHLFLDRSWPVRHSLLIWSMKALNEVVDSFSRAACRRRCRAGELELVLVDSGLRLVQARTRTCCRRCPGPARTEAPESSAHRLEAPDGGAGRRGLGHLRVLPLPRATPMRILRCPPGSRFPLLGRNERNDVRGIGLAELHRLCPIRNMAIVANRMSTRPGQCRDAIGHRQREEFNGNAELFGEERGNSASNPSCLPLALTNPRADCRPGCRSRPCPSS